MSAPAGASDTNALAGRRIVLTRSRDDCEAWAVRLRAAGADAVIHPCIESEFIDTPALRASLAAELAAADWLVVTSRRGVEAVAVLYGGTLPAHLKIAAVGETTAHAAETRLGRIDLIGAGTAALLGRTLASELAGRRRARVLLALAENARHALERELGAARADVVRLDVYRTLPARAGPAQSLAALAPDAVWLASPSAVEGFCHRTALDAEPALISIGPSTSEAVREHGLTVSAEARRPNFEGLLEATRCRTQP